jgi:hypothetical protein
VQTVDQLSLEGEALKQRGMRLADLAEPEPWKQTANGVVRYLAALGRPFTSERVRELAGDPTRPNALGALMNANARAGVIKKAGYTEADRASRHRAIVALWIGVGA